MKQILQNVKTGKMSIEEVPVPIVKSGGILVKNYYSLISAGTERMVIDFTKKSLIGKARERPDLAKQVLNKMKNEGVMDALHAAFNKMDEPLALGYSSVGEVIEVGKGVEEFKVGDIAACAGGGYATHSEIIFVPKNLAVKVDKEKLNDLRQCAFVTIGSIVMHGIRQAEVSLGETVAVIGLGLLGQIAVQMLKSAGCKVIGIDIDDYKLDVAKNYLDYRVNSKDKSVVDKIYQFTNGRGADKIIITASTKSNDVIELAGMIARDRAIVVAIGAVRMDIPRKIYYDKELILKQSRSYGPGRYDPVYEEKGIDYPVGYVRWTEKRNMEEFINLIEEKKINLLPIITHQFDISKALDAYKLVTENPNHEKYIGVLLGYKDNIKGKKIERKIKVTDVKYKSTDVVKIGLIGAGNFTRSTMLPNLSKVPNVHFRIVCSAKGVNAKSVAKKYGFEYASTDYKETFKDKDINLVIITTPHNLHGPMVIEALNNNKAVYVEKPLAINMEQLREVYQANMENNGRILVGFNRRFSPLAQMMKKNFDVSSPLMIHYTVNAGMIPKDHWVNDPDVGGGRIVGEVCHFIDLMQYLADSKPVRVFAEKISTNNENVIPEDNIFATIYFENGSLGNILYTSLGDKTYPKERIEIFGNNSVGVINNFKSAIMVKNGRTKKINLHNQDKGFINEYKMMVNSVLNGKDFDISFESILLTTLTTLKIRESLMNGKPVSIDLNELTEE